MSSTPDHAEQTSTPQTDARVASTDEARVPEPVRTAILSDPEAVLEDPEIMRALVSGAEPTSGNNVVDLRTVAMERLEARLDRLEDTHRNVIAAAYENLAGANQIHRAILRLMDADTFEAFLKALRGDVGDTLRVDSVCLVLETPEAGVLVRDSEGLIKAPPGSVEAYITQGRTAPARQITLRAIPADDADRSDLLPDGLFGAMFDSQGPEMRCEACLRLDLGIAHPPAMLVFGARDPHLFTPQQGTDLLAFFAGICERALRRWLI